MNKKDWFNKFFIDSETNFEGFLVDNRGSGTGFYKAFGYSDIKKDNGAALYGLNNFRQRVASGRIQFGKPSLRALASGKDAMKYIFGGE